MTDTELGAGGGDEGPGQLTGRGTFCVLERETHRLLADGDVDDTERDELSELRIDAAGQQTVPAGFQALDGVVTRSFHRSRSPSSPTTSARNNSSSALAYPLTCWALGTWSHSSIARSNWTAASAAP